MSPKTKPRESQLQLFRLEDPLTARFGAGFFREIPRLPGVYFFSDDADRLLYIGQSRDLRARVGSYRFVNQSRHPRRLCRLVAAVRRIRWRICPTDARAIELERTLLLEYHPPFNRAGVWRGSPWWLAHEIIGQRLELRLNQIKEGLGPLPAGFRHAFGPLLRAVFRRMEPDMPAHAFPHALLRATAPRSVGIRFSDPTEAWELLARGARGEIAGLLEHPRVAPDPASDPLGDLWLDDRDRIAKLAR